MKIKITLFALAIFFIPSLSFASTFVSQEITSDTVWTKANSPYVLHVFGLSVSSGATLTIEPGVIVKAPQNNTPLVVNGILKVNGTASDPVYFTSFNDTTVGGNTGNSPYGNTWSGIMANQGSVIQIEYANIRNANTGIKNNGGKVTVSNSVFENDTYGVFHLTGTTNTASNSFQNNGKGISSSGTGTISFTGNIFSNSSMPVYFDLSNGLTFTNSGNTAAGTGRKGFFLYGTGNNISNQTLSSDDIPYVITIFGVNIPAGKTLTVEPGAIIKFEQSNAFLRVDGDLDVRGTLLRPVYITSISDDTLGGDTDGILNAAPNYNYSNWGNIMVNSGGTAHLEYVSAYKGGRIINNGGNLSVSHSEILNTTDYGISHSAGNTNISSTTFNNNSYGFYAGGTGVISFTDNVFANERSGSAYLELSGGLNFTNSNNTAIGTGRHGFFLFSNGNNTMSDQVFSEDAVPYVVTVFGVSIPAEKTLTIKPGAIVKFEQNNVSITINGTLDVQGTNSKPVYFTYLSDDTVGGDSDGGSNLSYINKWDKIAINSGATANITHVVFRKGGYFNGAILNSGGNLTISNSEIFGSYGSGIEHRGGTTNISQSSIHDNVYGIYNNTSDNINAKNNYWGSVSGPKHLSNPLGTGNKVTNFVDFIPFLKYDPTVVTDGISKPVTTEDDGVQDSKGVADKTKFTFDVSYTGTSAPDDITLVANNGVVPHFYSLALSATTTNDGIFTNGEYYTFTSTFPKGNYSYHFEANNGKIRFPSTGELPFTTGYSNVAFLPGLEASRLFSPNGVELWEPEMPLHNNSQLYMNDNGTSKVSGIIVGDVIDNAYVPVKGNVYASFLAKMAGMKADGTIHDWQTFPYDWRYSVEDTVTTSMIQKFRALAETSDTGKVTIIAHSNGGLVAKELTIKLGDEASKLTDQMIFVASPEAGTPSAVGAVLHGFQQGLPFDWFHPIISPDEARTLAKNMPSAYGLLPSENYFTYTNDPVVTFADSPLLANWRTKYGSTIHSGERLRNFMTDQSRESLPVQDGLNDPLIGNQMLFDKAADLHNSLDSWIPPEGVELTEIAGWGEETLKTIAYYQGLETGCVLITGTKTCRFEQVLQFKPIMTIDGDGTVVTSSALWTTGAKKYWVDLKKYNIPFVRIRKHADILEIPSLLDFTKNIITRNNSTLPSYIFTSVPPYGGNETRLHFTLHSPLTLDLYDDHGNHTGVSSATGEVEENIPGSRYFVFGDVQYASVPNTEENHLVMNGYKDGSFTLNVEETSGNTTVKSTTFAGMPTSSTTIVTMDIPQGGSVSDDSPLLVDENGDKIIDTAFISKDGEIVLPDITDPKTEAVMGGMKGSNDWYTSDVSVSFSAIDEESGVKDTFYSLDNSLWATTTSFVVSKEGTTTVQFFSLDKAGNREATSTLEIKIDKTAPKAVISADPKSVGLNIEGIDDTPTKVVRKGNDYDYIITDLAGHTTKLFFQKVSEKKLSLNLRLFAVQYDNAPKKYLSGASFSYEWDIFKNAKILSEQKVEVKRSFEIEADFDPKKNMTTVESDKIGVKKLKQKFTGLKVIQFTVDKGMMGYVI